MPTLELFFQHLAASGTVALVLGLAVYVLWKTNREQRIYYEGDPKDPDRNPGLIKRMQTGAQKREDELRKHYEELIAKERDAQGVILDDLFGTLRDLK